tara:strand:+ start:515 stop:709 length:195 start_codon:yes stop_codon:yes gene_type:complete
MNISERKMEQIITELKEHLESACHAAHKLRYFGVIDTDFYEREFNTPIAMIEASVHTMIEEARQ